MRPVMLVHSKNHSALVTKTLDRLLLHPVIGLVFFMTVMYTIFWCSHAAGLFFQECFSQIFQFLRDFPSLQVLQRALNLSGHCPRLLWCVGLGAIEGCKTVLGFVPNLMVLFWLLQLLESTGFMARVSQTLEACLVRLGLEGRSFIPLLLGLGCNVPAIAACRNIQDPRKKLLTIQMLPFMACNARISIFSAFAALFFPQQGNLVLWSLYCLGFLVAGLTFWMLSPKAWDHRARVSETLLPPWQKPHLWFLFRTSFSKVKAFVLKIAVFIIPACTLMFALFQYGQIGGEGIEETALAHFAKKMSFLFHPLGFGPSYWPLVLSLLVGILAKEMVLSCLGAIYGLGLNQMATNVDPSAVLAFLVFTLLYMPCVSVIASIARELNWRWACFSFVWSTALAYWLGAATYQCFTHDYLRLGVCLGLGCLALVLIKKILGGYFKGSFNHRKVITTTIVVSETL